MEEPRTQTSSLRYGGRGFGRNSGKTAVGTRDGRMVALVVDDDARRRRDTVAMLQRGGYEEVLTESNYVDASATVKRWLPDLIVIAVKQGGAAFAESVRSLYEDPLPLRDLKLPAEL